MQDERSGCDPAERSRQRSFPIEAELALSALDCILNGEKGIYASSELTTGRRAYRLLDEHGVSNGHELREKLGENPHQTLLLDPNVEAAAEFARRLRGTLGSREIVITPAPFVAPGWTQAEYLHFWETLIRTRVRAVYFNEAWEYSNGCTFEFAAARQAGIPTYDAAGEPLGLDRGIELIAQALDDLKSRGVSAPRLRTNLERLEDLRAPKGQA